MGEVIERHRRPPSERLVNCWLALIYLKAGQSEIAKRPHKGWENFFGRGRRQADPRDVRRAFRSLEERGCVRPVDALTPHGRAVQHYKLLFPLEAGRGRSRFVRVQQWGGVSMAAFRLLLVLEGCAGRDGVLRADVTMQEVRDTLGIGGRVFRRQMREAKLAGYTKMSGKTLAVVRPRGIPFGRIPPEIAEMIIGERFPVTMQAITQDEAMTQIGCVVSRCEDAYFEAIQERYPGFEMELRTPERTALCQFVKNVGSDAPELVSFYVQSEIPEVTSVARRHGHSLVALGGRNVAGVLRSLWAVERSRNKLIVGKPEKKLLTFPDGGRDRE